MKSNIIKMENIPFPNQRDVAKPCREVSSTSFGSSCSYSTRAGGDRNEPLFSLRRSPCLAAGCCSLSTRSLSGSDPKKNVTADRDCWYTSRTYNNKIGPKKKLMIKINRMKKAYNKLGRSRWSKYKTFRE